MAQSRPRIARLGIQIRQRVARCSCAQHRARDVKLPNIILTITRWPKSVDLAWPGCGPPQRYRVFLNRDPYHNGPEKILGEAIDPRCGHWALGVDSRSDDGRKSSVPPPEQGRDDLRFSTSRRGDSSASKGNTNHRFRDALQERRGAIRALMKCSRDLEIALAENHRQACNSRDTSGHSRVNARESALHGECPTPRLGYG